MSKEELKALRKNASQWGLFWGALALALGAVICLIYLLIYEPWKFPAPPSPAAAPSGPAVSPK